MFIAAPGVKLSDLFLPDSPFLYLLLGSLFLIVVFILITAHPPKSKIMRSLEKIVFAISFPAFLLNFFFTVFLIWERIQEKPQPIENCDPDLPLNCVGVLSEGALSNSDWMLVMTPFALFALVSLLFIVGRIRLSKKRQNQVFPKQINNI